MPYSYFAAYRFLLIVLCVNSSILNILFLFSGFAFLYSLIICFLCWLFSLLCELRPGWFRPCLWGCLLAALATLPLVYHYLDNDKPCQRNWCSPAAAAVVVEDFDFLARDWEYFRDSSCGLADCYPQNFSSSASFQKLKSSWPDIPMECTIPSCVIDKFKNRKDFHRLLYLLPAFILFMQLLGEFFIAKSLGSMASEHKK